MFIHQVKTPRNLEVKFRLTNQSRKNQVSVLTGPNGSGKTDVLATIARVFHDRRQKASDSSALIHWSKGSNFRQSTHPMDWRYDDYVEVRMIAQTFSPFSRFPAAVRRSPAQLSAIYAHGDESDEEYICIGFHQSSRTKLNQLSLSIVEHGILRLSEKPATAKIAFDVLTDLGFKDGVKLTYRSSKLLTAIIESANEPELLEPLLLDSIGKETLKVGEVLFEYRSFKRLRRELILGDPAELAEHLCNAINLATEYMLRPDPAIADDSVTFEYPAFYRQEGMATEFAYLQAFSLLARLGLLDVVGCELNPIVGYPVDLTKASSGQQQMLCSIFGLAAALRDDTVVLVDEPELSLHPRWQMNYLTHLEAALENFVGCHVIIATHSPLITQAAEIKGMQTVSIGHDPSAHLHRGYHSTKATSIEHVLIETFDTPIPDSIHITNEIFSLISQSEGGTLADKKKSLERLSHYLNIYQRHGDASENMRSLLLRALKIVEQSRPAMG